MCRRKSFRPHMQKEKNYFKVCRFLNNLPIFSSVGGKNYSFGDAQRHEDGGGSSFSEPMVSERTYSVGHESNKCPVCDCGTYLVERVEPYPFNFNVKW